MNMPMPLVKSALPSGSRKTFFALRVLAPLEHGEGVVHREADDFVHAQGLEIGVEPPAAREMGGKSRWGEGAGQGRKNDFLPPKISVVVRSCQRNGFSPATDSSRTRVLKTTSGTRLGTSNQRHSRKIGSGRGGIACRSPATATGR